jgi:DNA polymerase I
MPVCPFPTGPDVQVICFQAKAEGSCFAALGWQPPARVVDLFVERLRLLNPSRWPSLLMTRAAYGLVAMSCSHKNAMRELIIHSNIFTPEEKAAILRYCLEDVLATIRLMEVMDAAGHIHWDQAEWRGTCNFCYGCIENYATPIDIATYRRFIAQRKNIILGMIANSQAKHGFDVYRGTTFDKKKLAALLEQLGIVDWPRAPFGQLSVAGEVTGRMAGRHPILAAIHELRTQLDQLHEIELSIGDDGRNRFDFRTFGSLTMRCQPSTSANIMALAAWMRGLVWADPHRPYVLAVIDWVAQEFGIGASRSRDPVMQKAYQGDVHIGTAIAMGQAPVGATKSTHAGPRKIGKAPLSRSRSSKPGRC